MGLLVKSLKKETIQGDEKCLKKMFLSLFVRHEAILPGDTFFLVFSSNWHGRNFKFQPVQTLMSFWHHIKQLWSKPKTPHKSQNIRRRISSPTSS